MTTGQPVDFPNFAFANEVLDGSGINALIAHCDATGAEGMVAEGMIAAKFMAGIAMCSIYNPPIS